MLTLEYFDKVKSKIPASFYENRLKKGYEVIKNKVDGMLFFVDGVLGLIMVDDTEMQTINRSHRGFDKPTDVVALSYIEAHHHPDHFPSGFEMAGEIFISIDTAKKQAKEKGHSLEKELETLFVHGFLHVFGFDHQTDEEEAEMESWAKKICNLES